MESYLAKLFNHGAVAANIFSWGMGGEAERERNLFRRVTENRDALDAYRKFLSGQPLQEQQSTGPSAGDRLREKIAKIQKQLPAWINGRPERLDTAKALMQYLDKAVKSNSYQQMDSAADEVLRRLSQ
jgi:hypothetical protein